VTLYNLNASPAATSPQPIADLRFLTKLTASLGTHVVSAQEVIPVDGGNTWTSVPGSVKVVAQPAYLVGDTDGDFDVDLTDYGNVVNHLGGTGLGDTTGDGGVDLTDYANVVNNLGRTLAHGSGSEALDAPLTASASASSSPSTSAPIMAESSLGLTVGAPAALSAVQNLSSTLMVGPAMAASPVMSIATTKVQSVISSLPTHNASVAAAESHAAVFALPTSYESGSDNSRLVGSTQSSDALTVESQPVAADTVRASDSFFEALQSDEAADAMQRTDSVGTDSHAEESTDDYYEALSSDSGSQLLV